jgi:hypothetical protein
MTAMTGLDESKPVRGKLSQTGHQGESGFFVNQKCCKRSFFNGTELA